MCITVHLKIYFRDENRLMYKSWTHFLIYLFPIFSFFKDNCQNMSYKAENWHGFSNFCWYAFRIFWSKADEIDLVFNEVWILEHVWGFMNYIFIKGFVCLCMLSFFPFLFLSFLSYLSVAFLSCFIAGCCKRTLIQPWTQVIDCYYLS